MPPEPHTLDAPLSRRQQMLLDYLRERENDPPGCPACNYSLQALTRPVCPECGHELVLTVGAARHPIGWLLVSVAPGFFSGIAAIFVMVPIIGRIYFGDGVWMWQLIMMDAFGWLSGLFALILAFALRSRFLAWPPKRQRKFAITIWLIHVAALGFFFLIGFLFF